VSYVPGATFTVTACSSVGELETGAQSLAGLTPGKTDPVQPSVTVTPADVGTVTVLVAGVDAGAESVPRKAAATTITRPKSPAENVRGLIAPPKAGDDRRRVRRPDRGAAASPGRASTG
jgi:hypothetical protein